jgi:2-amino-4-hydroxy-6-hydroxymethyldihydropteridine diphosphokinase
VRIEGALGRGGRANLETVVVGLGGNLGTEAEIAARFAAAERRLARLVIAIRVSSLYRTEPWGPVADQPRFLNAACAFFPRPGLEPLDLLLELWSIERALGRRRPSRPRFGPRPIDLDLLVWGRRRYRSPVLTLPHPRLHEREFALQPVRELLGTVP